MSKAISKRMRVLLGLVGFFLAALSVDAMRWLEAVFEDQDVHSKVRFVFVHCIAACYEAISELWVVQESLIS